MYIKNKGQVKSYLKGKDSLNIEGRENLCLK